MEDKINEHFLENILGRTWWMHTNWRRKKSDSMSQIGFLFWRYRLAMQLFVCLFACMFVCLFVCFFVCFYVPLENISLIDMDVTIAGEGQQNFTRRLWPLSGEGGGVLHCVGTSIFAVSSKGPFLFQQARGTGDLVWTWAKRNTQKTLTKTNIVAFYDKEGVLSQTELAKKKPNNKNKQ